MIDATLAFLRTLRGSTCWILMTCLWGSPGLEAQTCEWSSGFHKTGLNGAPAAIAAYDDGNGLHIYAAGNIRSADDLAVAFIAKWDGQKWSAVGTGLDGPVESLIVFDDGSGPALYAGGQFEHAGAVEARHIARWNGQEWLPLGEGLAGRVTAMVVYDDGGGPVLYAGHSPFYGSSQVGLSKWNGSSWNLINSLPAENLVVFDDGTGPAIYGSTGYLESKIFKLVGSSYATLGDALGNQPLALFSFDDGSGPALYVGGAFSQIGGIQADRVARWDGSTWTAVGSGLSRPVESFAVFDDGTGVGLLAGGGGFLSKWDGANWVEFPNSPQSDYVGVLATYDSGSGPKLVASGVSFASIAQWDGAAWLPLSSKAGMGTSSGINVLKVLPYGGSWALYAGGTFVSAGNTGARVAKWDGTSWSGFAGGIIAGSIESIAATTDGSDWTLWAGSGSKVYPTSSGTALARWDGSGWTPLVNSGSTFDLVGYDDGNGGALHAAYQNGVSTYVMRWDGTSLLPVGEVLSRPISRILPFSDVFSDYLLAAGDFGLELWDGSSWSSLSDNWFHGHIDAALEYAPFRYYFAGQIYDNTLREFMLAEFGASGKVLFGPLDESGISFATVEAIALFDSGSGSEIYVGGSFKMEGQDYSLLKWNGINWLPIPNLSGTRSGEVNELAVFDDGDGPALFVGGIFSTVGGVVSANFAKYSCAAKADLELSLDTPVSPPVLPGDSFVYSLAIGNRGAVGDPAAKLVDVLPSSLTCSYTSLASGGATGNSPSGSGNLVETLSLPPGSTVVYSFNCTVVPSAKGQPTHTAKIFSSVPEGNLDNNAASQRIQLMPGLLVPAVTETAFPLEVELPIGLITAGRKISAVSFSIDYDPACLDPDLDGDGVLDNVTLNASNQFSVLSRLDPLDSDGEIDISILDWNPPIAEFVEGELLRIGFAVTCSPANSPMDSPVKFSAAPAPTFGDSAGQPVLGLSRDGMIRILAGLRGDCNRSGEVGASDLTAEGLEIFDGDGDFWADAPGSSFAGSPVGCDSNASEKIDAADVVCTNLILFGDNCSSRAGETFFLMPRVEVSTAFDGNFNWIRSVLTPNGNAVGSIAYSLDLDPALFDLAKIDMDGNGMPDHLRFPSGSLGLSYVRFDSLDTDGELDILVANFSQPLALGTLVEIGVPATAALKRSPAIAAQPAPSLGSSSGTEIPGIFVEGALLFGDGFESGTTAAWSLVSSVGGDLPR